MEKKIKVSVEFQKAGINFKIKEIKVTEHQVYVVGEYEVEGEKEGFAGEITKYQGRTVLQFGLPHVIRGKKVDGVAIDNAETMEAITKVVEKLREEIKKEQEIVRAVIRKLDADGDEVEIVDYVNIPFYRDRFGNFVNEEKFKKVLKKEGIKEISKQDLIKLWEEKYAEKNAKIEEAERRYYKRMFEHDAVEVGERQAVENLFAEIPEKEADF